MEPVVFPDSPETDTREGMPHPPGGESCLTLLTGSPCLQQFPHSCCYLNPFLFLPPFLPTLFLPTLLFSLRPFFSVSSFVISLLFFIILVSISLCLAASGVEKLQRGLKHLLVLALEAEIKAGREQLECSFRSSHSQATSYILLTNLPAELFTYYHFRQNCLYIT